MSGDIQRRLKLSSVEIKKRNMAEEVLECLMEWIMDGMLQMGDKLPSALIADKLHVSRMPVREAMNMLEKKGIAVSEPNVGMRLVELKPSDIREIYHIRQMLEPDIAFYACRHSTTALIHSLEKIHEVYVDLLMKEELNAKDVHLQNRKFHFSIYKAAAMPRQFTIIENLWDTTCFFKMIYGESFLRSKEGKEHMIAEHQSYIDLLKSGQAEELRQSMMKNISNKLIRYEKQWSSAEFDVV
jgi:DNA-binding GntR family transcriptional regulator